MAQNLWLQCKVTAGQFSDERAVFGKDFSGTEFSLFVPDHLVETETDENSRNVVDGWIQVTPLGENGDLVLVGLPRPALENRLTVTVRRSATSDRPAKQKV